MSEHLFRDPREPGKPLIPRQTWDMPPFNRWSFQHMRDLFPTTPVWRGRGPSMPLPEARRDLRALSFDSINGTETLNDFLGNSFIDGFLVISKGKIVEEIYQNGMQPQTLHLSQSMAKSVTAMVAGILIERGVIDPTKLITDYLPELEATAYRGATLQHVFDMTSGVLFDETYDKPDSHMAMLDRAAGWKPGLSEDWPSTTWDLILTLTETECPHGESFRYRSIETDILAFAMQRTTGKMLAELVSEELWQTLGAEEDGCFTVDPAGYALADGGFNATLRDYGRFAMMVAQKGAFFGNQIVPQSWVMETLNGNHDLFQGDYRKSLPNGAYHNQFWLEDPAKPVLICRGVFGQMIYCNLETESAVVILASRPDFLNTDYSIRALALCTAVNAHLG